MSLSTRDIIAIIQPRPAPFNADIFCHAFLDYCGMEADVDELENDAEFSFIFDLCLNYLDMRSLPDRQRVAHEIRSFVNRVD